MRKVEVFVEMSLQKTIIVEVGEKEEAEYKARELIADMNYKEYTEFLSSLDNNAGVYIKEVTLEEKVKMAIDFFDPYCIFPGEFGPSDEYDGESSRIAAKIKLDMSKEEVSDVIAKEFSRSFNQIYSIEECMAPAEKIYDYLTVLE